MGQISDTVHEWRIEGRVTDDNGAVYDMQVTLRDEALHITARYNEAATAQNYSDDQYEEELEGTGPVRSMYEKEIDVIGTPSIPDEEEIKDYLDQMQDRPEEYATA